MLYPLSYGRVLAAKRLVYSELVDARFLLAAIGRGALLLPFCNGIATDSCRYAEAPHAVLQPGLLHVQVRRGLFERGVPEHVLDVMQRPPGFEHSRGALVPQIVEVEIDRLERRVTRARGCSPSTRARARAPSARPSPTRAWWS